MNQDRLKSRRRNTALKKTFGLNYNQYLKMLDEQDHKCFICNEKENVNNRILSVDHDHTTGAIRGLLCTNCNTGLGKLKDNPNLLRRAIEYLEREYSVPLVEETHYFISHTDRQNWKRIVHTPEGLFSSNQAAASYYNVNEATMLSWCGLNKNKPHLAREGFKSEKVYMSTNEIKDKYNVKD